MPDVMRETPSPTSGPGDARTTSSPPDPTRMKQAAGTAVEQGKDVVQEARGQLGSLTDDARQQVREQSGIQKDRAASGLRQLGDELSSMSPGMSATPGVATELVQEAGRRAHDFAGWLDQHDPGDLLDELRDLGRRRPGAFLVGALAAGIVAGRLTRGVVDEKRSDSPQRFDGDRARPDEIDLGGP